jgi:hypothetical protein
MIKVISITRVTELLLIVWVDEDRWYQPYVCTPAFTSKHGPAIDKRQYRNYEHFCGVMGKFQPLVEFFAEAQETDHLSWKTAIIMAEERQIRLASY